jgi:hypothetical protein
MTCVTQPMSLRCNTSLVPMPLRPMPYGFPTTLGHIVICHYGLCQHLTPPMSFKFILSLGFDRCYMSLGCIPIKPHMCHFTYVIHVYVIKFILGLCHLNQVYFIQRLEVCVLFGLVSLRSNHLHLTLMP